MYKSRLTLPGDIGQAGRHDREDRAAAALERRRTGLVQCRGRLPTPAGVRWYLPGESGECARPESITLPKLDETVRPDFAIRHVNFRFGTAA